MLLPEKFIRACVLFNVGQGISRGSGFLIKWANKLFLITAKHVVYRNGDLYSKEANISALSGSYISVQLGATFDLEKINTINVGAEILALELGDFIVRDSGEQIKFSDYVSSTGVFSSRAPEFLSQADMDLDNSVALTQVVYLVAFPSTYFRTKTEIKFDQPFVRQGIVSCVQKPVLILDCASHLKNSGGLAIASFEGGFKVIGVINEFVPFREDLVSAQHDGQVMMSRFENSGLTLAMQIDYGKLPLIDDRVAHV